MRNFVVFKHTLQKWKSFQFHLPLCQARTFSDTKSPYLITTPIFYVNSVPHIGHLYTALLADAHHRFTKLLQPNRPTIFSTGTDEHGLKIQQAASKQGVTPGQLCDDVSGKFRGLFNRCGIEYTDYIRTTELRHKEVVCDLWKKLEQNGDLYKDKYESWYSVQDECFLTDTQVEARGGVHYSIESGHPVEWASEVNWVFRLERQRQPLLDWLESTDIRPRQFVPQVRAWLEDPRFCDLSVSRPSSRLSWGIPVPGDPSQTIYVWLDALANYLTVAGYNSNDMSWPPSVHVIGKDILKFHCIYWPAFLLAAGMEPPKRLLVHSHWLAEGVKMSKSLGNVVDPSSLMEKYGVDGTRYFLLREGVPHSDGNYEEQKMVHYLNLELADTLGNLLNRATSKGVNKNQTFPCWEMEFIELSATGIGFKLMAKLSSLAEDVEVNYEAFNFYQGIISTMDVLRLTNQFVQEEEPWKLKNSDLERLNFVLHLTFESLRVCGIILQPIVPNISKMLLDKLGISPSDRTWNHAKQLSWTQHDSCKLDLSEEKCVLYQKLRGN